MIFLINPGVAALIGLGRFALVNLDTFLPTQLGKHLRSPKQKECKHDASVQTKLGLRVLRWWRRKKKKQERETGKNEIHTVRLRLCFVCYQPPTFPTSSNVENYIYNIYAKTQTVMRA